MLLFFSLRAQFGTDEMKNAVHGSSSMNKALNVINEFFPDVQVNDEGIVVHRKFTSNCFDFLAFKLDFANLVRIKSVICTDKIYFKAMVVGYQSHQ